MLLTALPPAPPTPKTVIRGFSSWMSGGVMLSAMGASRITRAWVRPGRRAREMLKIVGNGNRSSEALAKPSSNLSEIAAVGPCSELPRMPRFDMFELSVLRVDQKPGGDRERRGLRLTGQPAKAKRPADADRTAEYLSCEFDEAGELRGSAAQDDLPPGLSRKGRIRKPVPDHFKNLLRTVADDIGNRGL